MSGHKGELTGGSVGCQIPQAEAGTLRAEAFQFNAAYTDWHLMKDPRFRGLNLIACLDDASRCVAGARLFKEAASENAVVALRQAIREFGTCNRTLRQRIVLCRQGRPQEDYRHLDSDPF